MIKAYILKNIIAITSLLFFLVIGTLVYANSFDNEFIWDDDDSIVNNTYIKNWNHLPDFFTQNLIAGSGQITDYWRPVLLISFALDYNFWQLNPTGFHITNTLLHIFNAWLTFLFLRLIARTNPSKNDTKINRLSLNEDIIPFIIALFFLVHPLNTEAITYIAGRADPLSSIFSLLSLLCYTKYRLKHNPKLLNLSAQSWLYPSSLLLFILALMTKEQVILLPFIIAITEFICISQSLNKKRFFRAVKMLLPFFILSIIYLSIRLTILDFNDMFSGFSQGESYDNIILHRLLTFTYVIILYLKLLFIPTGLHMAREITPITSIFSLPVIFFITLIITTTKLCIKTWHTNRLITFGILWFSIILLPRTNIFQINRPMYEHWLYLPMIGFWLALLYSMPIFTEKFTKINRLPKTLQIKILISASIFVTIIFSSLTIIRNSDWKDAIVFYETNLSYTPNSFIQHNNLGMAYANNNEFEAAIREYKLSLAIADEYPQVHSNLANSLLALGYASEAIIEYKKAIEMNPTFSIPYYKLLSIYISQKDIYAIEKILTYMNDFFPTDINYLYSKGIIYFDMGNYTKAIDAWQILHNRTNSPEIHNLIKQAQFQHSISEKK
ncbi:tetratricopeptide repeat protein [Patescibacteria group bacterium]|nr:tetratricopeptide repeat protein [Patescibacteria group bacterium]